MFPVIHDCSWTVIPPSLEAPLYSLTLHTYKYISHEDVCDAFVGDTLLAVVAPSGTQLEVPMPETVTLNILSPLTFFLHTFFFNNIR